MTNFIFRPGPRPIFVFDCSYRAAPEGGEGSRRFPWVMLGPPPKVWMLSYVDQAADTMETARHVGPSPTTKARTYPGCQVPLIAAASYPKLTMALQQEPCLSAYRYWEAMTIQGSPRIPPTMSGWGDHLQLAINGEPLRPVEEYTQLLENFLGLVNFVERNMDAPSAAELPLPILPVNVNGVPGPYRVHRCPRCGNYETSEIVFEGATIFTRARVNYRTMQCKALLYASPR